MENKNTEVISSEAKIVLKEFCPVCKNNVPMSQKFFTFKSSPLGRVVSGCYNCYVREIQK